MIMESTDITPELVKWSNSAGLQVTQGSDTSDRRTIVWSELGETRYFISQHPNGWFILTDSERMGPEQFVFGASSMEIIERFLYSKFGASYRGRMRLPRLAYPSKMEDVADGYNIVTTKFEGADVLGLVDTRGETVAITRPDPIVGVADLAKISNYMSVPIEVIKTSFLSPNGKPLFSIRGA